MISVKKIWGLAIFSDRAPIDEAHTEYDTLIEPNERQCNDVIKKKSTYTEDDTAPYKSEALVNALALDICTCKVVAKLVVIIYSLFLFSHCPPPPS